MLQIQKVLAVALAEVRSARRLVRYWMFSILSVLISLLIYLYYSAIHGFASSLSASIGATGPRFLISAMGIYLMAIFMIGMIFLAFDVRARDQRERMAEVLDSRPITNLELLTGRLIGLVFMAWLPFVFVAGLLQTFGGIARLFGWWLGEAVEPWSLLGFVVVDGLTALILWCSVVIFLAVTVRNRLLVTGLAFALLGLQVWSFFRTPLYLQPVLSALSSFSSLASDVLPRFLSGPTAVQRLAMLVLSAGLLVMAAALHPRPDSGSKKRQLLIGSGLVLAAFLCIGFLVIQARGAIDTRESWAQAHEARRNDPRPDLEAVTGVVRIDPGKRLRLELDLAVAAPSSGPLESLLFSFNPGLDIEQLRVDGSDAPFEHELGLLQVELSQTLQPGTRIQLTLEASGTPDPFFAYLDSSKELLTGTAMQATIAILGTDGSIFDRKYVALMPGVRWLPMPGAAVPTGDPVGHPTDFFDLDLEVEVPSGWLVAGPGRRQESSGGDGDRYRFHPDAPVPEVGLMASRFERRAIEVAGVELELLFNRKHRRNFDFFADIEELLSVRLEELFGDAERFGLAYPYGSLSVVEIPAHLRSYGGGWRMDTVQTLPAILLLREQGFPTSRFDFEFRDPESFEDREGGMPAAKLETLETFFENDFSGGNPFLGASRNFLQYQTSATGEGAIALDFLTDELVNQLLTSKGGFFSAHIFDTAIGSIVGETITQMVTGNTQSVADAVLAAAADRPSVWDLALGTSLASLEPTEDPRQALNVLALKSRALAKAILDGLGRDQTAALLAELRRRHTGENYDEADLDAIATDLGIDLESVIGDWLHDASLPGFMVSPVKVDRLADDDQGRPRYQTRLHLRNDEPTPGLVRLRYAVGEADQDADWNETEPIRIAGQTSVEIGLLSSEPPRQLWLAPYLSLNRQSMRLDLPEIDQETEVSLEPFLGTRPSDWQLVAADAIVVDDLDPGFSVETDETTDGVRLSGGLSTFFVPAADLDQGLPEYQPFGGPPTKWSRQEIPSSWGKYRHTIAMVRSGDGKQKVVFSTELPATGRWRLDYHLPMPMSNSVQRERGVRVNAQLSFAGTEGTYDLTLDVGGEEQVVEFDGSAAEPGWNQLGEFDLTSRQVRLVVSNQTSEKRGLVLADAIRWSPVGKQ